MFKYGKRQIGLGHVRVERLRDEEKTLTEQEQSQAASGQRRESKVGQRPTRHG